MARQIVVDIVGDSSKFNKSTSDAVSSAGKMEKGFKSSAIAGAAMGAAFSAVNAGIDLVVGSIGDASAAAKEDTASQDRLKLAYQNTGKAQDMSVAAIERVISANQAKGVSDSEQRKGISDFLDLTGSATEAMKLNQATIELAAAKGIAYADAESMIRSAAAGKTMALEKAGVETAKGASITEIATAVNDKFGGSLEAVAETQEGKSAIANEKMGEAMESVGRVINKLALVILPVLADALTFVAEKVVPVLQKAFDFLSKNIFPTLGQWINWISKNVIPPLITAFNAIAPVVSKVFGIVISVVRTVAPVVGSVFSTIAGVIGNFIGLIQKVVGIVQTVASRVGTAFRTMSNIIKAVFSGVVGVVKGVFNGIIGAINSVIRAINGIQVHIHVGPVNYDFWGLNLGYIPRLHTGGIVPGVPGSDVLTVLQAGERVLPRGEANQSNGVTIVVQGSIYGVDDLMDIIAMRLKLQGA